MVFLVTCSFVQRSCCSMQLLKSQLNGSAFRAMVDGAEGFSFFGFIVHIPAEAAAVDGLELMVVIDMGIAPFFMKIIHCGFDMEFMKIL